MSVESPSTSRSRLWPATIVICALAAGVWGWSRWQVASVGPTLTTQDIEERAAQSPPQPRLLPPFDFQGLTIPKEEVLAGGPPKDGIPAISKPQFVRPEEEPDYTGSERVIGVVIDGKARAYPLRILVQHEIVNDRFAGQSLAVTYCPLCDSSLVFDRTVNEREIEFGVSGLLYNSNVLMYDRNKGGPEALWSQMTSTAVSGQQVGQRLRIVPFEVTTWADWQARYPETDVMSQKTEFAQSYGLGQYGEYFSVPHLMFPARPAAPTDRFPLKEPMLGVWNEVGARAYPVSVFRKAGKSVQVGQSLGEATFTVVYDSSTKTLRLSDVEGSLDRAYVFWFAWYAFHPQTEVYSPN